MSTRVVRDAVAQYRFVTAQSYGYGRGTAWPLGDCFPRAPGSRLGGRY